MRGGLPVLRRARQARRAFVISEAVANSYGEYRNALLNMVRWRPWMRFAMGPAWPKHERK